MRRLLGAISDFCYLHYRSVLIFFLILSVLFLIGVGKLTIETDFLKLFPQDNTSIGAFVEILEDFDSLDRLYLLLEKRKPIGLDEFITEVEKVIHYLNALHINGTKAFTDIHHKFPNLDEYGDVKNILSLFIGNPLHFIDYEDIPFIEAQFDDKNMLSQLSKTRKSLIGQASYGLKEYVSIDPLSLRSLLERKLKENSGGFQFDTRTGYFLSVDQQSLLIIASPAKSASDLDFSGQLIHAISQYGTSQKNITISCTGACAIAVSNETTIKSDMIRSLFTALIGVLLLFYIVYRRFIILLFVSFPIIFGILFTFTMVSLTIGTINILTSVFSAIVVGLGIDFSIHLYDRFHSERALGKETREALRITLEETGKGVLTGGLTTICAFLSLYSASIEGINQFGFLIAMGIGSCLLSTYFILPSLLVWRDKRKRDYSYQPLGTYGLSQLSRHLERHSIIFLTVFLVFSLVMGYYCFRLSFESDLTKLGPTGEPTYVVQEKIRESFGNRGSELFVRKAGENLNTLIAQEDHLIEVLKESAKKGEVESYSSLGVLMNAEEKQAALLKKLTGNINFQEVSSSFDAHLEKLDFDKSHFQPMRTLLTTLQQTPHKLITSPDAVLTRLNKSSLRKLIDIYLILKEDTFTIITPLFLKDGEELSETLIRNIEQIGHSLRIVGIPLINQEILTMVKGDLKRCFFLAVCLILLCLSVHFRSTILVLFSLAPLLMGTLWMLGSMALCNIKLNAINVVILPMIIGIGIDSGVHIIQRYFENRAYDIKETVSHTGRAVIMASLTTIISFGSLITATHNALSLMGLVIILGIAFCLLNSLITLPTLLILSRRKTFRKHT